MSRSPSTPSTLSRRRWFAGAGAVGAVAAVATVLPGTSAASGGEVTSPKPAPEKGGGYTVSEHIKRYYQTTRV